MYSIKQYITCRYNNLQNSRALRENGYDVPISRDRVGKVPADLSKSQLFTRTRAINISITFAFSYYICILDRTSIIDGYHQSAIKV